MQASDLEMSQIVFYIARAHEKLQAVSDPDTFSPILSKLRSDLSMTGRIGKVADFLYAC
jgi:hypothetical protein